MTCKINCALQLAQKLRDRPVRATALDFNTDASNVARV